MAIIKNTKNAPLGEIGVGLYPDMFVSEKIKKSDDYQKTIMDYYTNMAVAQYSFNTEKFGYNYQFVKGKLRPQDFYENQEIKEFTISALEDYPLPNHIQQYSIFNQPLNTLCGEQSAKPDNARVKAYDDSSRSEELQAKTDILNQYIIQLVQEQIAQKAALQGVDLNTEEGQQYFQKLSEEQLQDSLTNYTSQAEKWGAKMLENLKMEFNTKELSEEAFRDILISGREYFHIFQDRSKLGFNLECVNPRNVWKEQDTNKKYTKDCYAAGILDVMEISQIIEKFPLTKEEIDHLRDLQNENYLVRGKPSTLFNNKTGLDSIAYNNFFPGKLEDTLENEPRLLSNPLSENYEALNRTGMLGQKFLVNIAYWLSKKLIGKLTYLDETGEPVVTLVDENYKKGSHPYELDLEWGWENRWWQGVKIGCDIYYTQPLEILDYCPILGVEFENRNTEVRSLIDLLKPYQILFNVFMNQTFEIAKKDLGMQYLMNWRKIPGAKDDELENAVDNLVYTAQELGMIFEDDSPENTKAPLTNQNLTRAIDLSRVNEMQGRLNMCIQIQQFANNLIGVNNERLGGVAATQTLGGTQAALAASYSQTAPWFNQHEYLMNQVYQSMLDVAQYVESNKPTSTISYISGTGEHAWININGSELKLRDLRVFITSRQKDQQTLNEMRQLGQAMLQNGASFYDVAQILVSDSIRDMQDTLKKDKIRRQQLEEQALQQQQQQIQAQQEGIQMQIQAQNQREEAQRQFELYMKKLDLDSKERIAALQLYSKDNLSSDLNNNKIPDVLELVKDQREALMAGQNYQLQQAKQASDLQNQSQKTINDTNKLKLDKEKFDKEYELKKEDLRIKEKQIDTNLKVARENKSQ